MSNFGHSELQSLMLAQDICSTIDNSELTKRISRLKPVSLKERPKTQIKEKKKLERQRFRIIPELKLAVDVLKSRLREHNEEKTVSRPCTRLKVERVENNLSPGCYHRMSLSIGGFEFSKVPRLDHSIECQISGIWVISTC